MEPLMPWMLWHDDTKRLRPRAIVKRRVHQPDFAVQCDEQPARLSADFGLADMKCVEVALLVETAKAHAADHEKELEGTARLEHIEPQFARVEPMAAAEGEQLHAVFVVSNEQAGRPI